MLKATSALYQVHAPFGYDIRRRNRRFDPRALQAFWGASLEQDSQTFGVAVSSSAMSGDGAAAAPKPALALNLENMVQGEQALSGQEAT